MTLTRYSREELRRVRAAREAGAVVSKPQMTLFAQVPVDASMEDGVVLGCWNGERFVPWEQWCATASIAVEQPTEPTVPPNAECVSAVCGGTKVWLTRDGDRWLMYAGSRKAAGKRRDFASPFLEHAIRTAEQWYGKASGDWREERRRDAKYEVNNSKAADSHIHGEDGGPLLPGPGGD